MAILECQQRDPNPRGPASRILIIAATFGLVPALLAFLSWNSSAVFLFVAFTPLLALPGLAEKSFGLSPSKESTRAIISLCAFLQFALYGLLVSIRFRGKLLIWGLIVLANLGWFMFLISQIGDI